MAGRPKDNPVDPYDLMAFAARRPEISRGRAFKLDGKLYGRRQGSAQRLLGKRGRSSQRLETALRMCVSRFDPLVLAVEIQYRMRKMYPGKDDGPLERVPVHDGNRLARLAVDGIFDTLESTNWRACNSKHRADMREKLDEMVAYAASALSDEIAGSVQDSRSKRFSQGSGGGAVAPSQFSVYLDSKDDEDERAEEEIPDAEREDRAAG